MTKKGINIGKKLVAEFMGLKHKDTFAHIEPKKPKIFGVHKNSYYERKNGSGFMLGGCYYNTEWLHLMPVLEKISKYGYPYLISNKTCTIYRVWMSNIIAHNHGKTTIEAAWLSVLDFIEWYNKQKK